MHKLKGFAGVFKSKFYPGIFKWPTFIIFILIFLQLSLGSKDAELNLGSTLTWLFWWTLLPIVFLFFGRIWCSICPFSTLSDLVQNVVGNKLKAPSILKKSGLWLIIILFILLTWSEELFELTESTRATAIFLMFIFTFALAFGAFFERRTWCRYMCPLGGIAGVYSRASFVAVRGDEDICRSCKTVECYKGTEDVPGCQMSEFPRVMSDNMYCNLCGDCIKNCPNDSVHLYIRKPTSELWDIKKFRVAESFIAIVIMGMMLLQNTMENNKEFIETLVPNFSFEVNYSIYFVLTILIANLVVLIFSFVSKTFNKQSVSLNFILLGISLIPLDLGVQIAHNLKELLGEGLLIAKGFAQLTNWLTPPVRENILDKSTITALQIIVLILGCIASSIVSYKLVKKNIETNKSILTFTLFLLVFVAFFAIQLYLTLA